MKILVATLAAAVLSAGAAAAACSGDMVRQQPNQTTAQTPVILPPAQAGS